VNKSELLLVIVIGNALVFDFTNGFHDTANAMATSIATRALRPKVAVALCAALNFAGAFLSIKVAATISQGIVDEGVLDLRTLFAALVGAIAWNLLTWAAGLPSSSSHARIGGLIGAGLVAGGSDSIKGSAIVEKVIAPGVLAPIICGLVAIIGTYAAYRIRARDPADETSRAYRYGQIGTASLVSLAHGTNDAQKTMGVITLALVAHGDAEPGGRGELRRAAVGEGRRGQRDRARHLRRRLADHPHHGPPADRDRAAAGLRRGGLGREHDPSPRRTSATRFRPRTWCRAGSSA
jgi:inorganic phosphate transporter, PiT family